MTPLLWWMTALLGCSGNENNIQAFVPELVVLPETLDFGDVVAGTTSTQNLTLSNDGKDELEISSIALSDGSSGVFSFDDTPITLEVNASIPLAVSFAPTEFTSYSDALIFTWNSDDNLPTTVPLLGAGVDIDRDSFGLAVQAYQTRALAVVDEVAAIARKQARASLEPQA